MQVNVISIMWDNYLGSGIEYVNKLYRSVVRNSKKYRVNFYCFTDCLNGFDYGIIMKPLPKLDNPKHGYLKEIGLCDNNLGDLTGERVFFFDLDNIILDNIDCFFDYVRNDNFYISRDLNHINNNTFGGAYIYSWIVGTLGYIIEDYEKNSDAIINKYHTASQEYLCHKVLERYQLNFWPIEWTAVFKTHCLPKYWLIRHFVAPKKPDKKTKVLTFGGHPKIKDAIDGKWSTINGEEVKWYKKWYKVNLPATWLSEYWI